MDEYLADQCLRAFERIESGVLQFSEQIPIIPENETIKAPILISHIIDACGLIDSLFRDLTPDAVNLEGQKLTRDKCGMWAFAKLHAKKLDIPNTRSVLLVSPPRYCRPFEPWENLIRGGSYADLSWWEDYNALKHDRLANIQKGTLGIALATLCALHQVIARRLDLIRIMIRRGWLSTGTYVIDGILEDAQNNSLSHTFVVRD